MTGASEHGGPPHASAAGFTPCAVDPAWFPRRVPPKDAPDGSRRKTDYTTTDYNKTDYTKTIELVRR